MSEEKPNVIPAGESEQVDGLVSVGDEIAEMLKQAENAQNGIFPQPEPATEEPSTGGTEEDESEETDLVDEDSETDSSASSDGLPDDGEEVAEADETDDESEEEAEEDNPDPREEAKKRRRNRIAKKKEALKRSWENADRRHREADQRQRDLDQREMAIRQREASLPPAPNDPLPKYSVEDIASSVSEFIDEGDVDTAKELVMSMAQKATAMAQVAQQGPQNPHFMAAWEQNRQAVLKDNPDLGDKSTALYEKSAELLDSDWGQVLTSHPTGIAATVEVAKLMLAAESVSELEARIKDLESENKKLLSQTKVTRTRTTNRQTKPRDKFHELDVEDQIAALHTLALRQR